jgi:hypothetical protein
MSQRHRVAEAPPPRAEHAARFRSERSRIQAELHELAKHVGPSDTIDDADEPGVAWKPLRHKDADRLAKQLDPTRKRRHWKLKSWKRRTQRRQQKAMAWREAAEAN